MTTKRCCLQYVSVRQSASSGPPPTGNFSRSAALSPNMVALMRYETFWSSISYGTLLKIPRTLTFITLTPSWTVYVQACFSRRLLFCSFTSTFVHNNIEEFYCRIFGSIIKLFGGSLFGSNSKLTIFARPVYSVN